MITKKQRRDPVVASPHIVGNLIMALNDALEFSRLYPREMAAARALFSHARSKVMSEADATKEKETIMLLQNLLIAPLCTCTVLTGGRTSVSPTCPYHGKNQS